MTKKTLTARIAIAGSLMALAALSACNDSKPEQPAATDNVIEEPAPNETAPVDIVTPVETAPAISSNASIDEPREAPPEPDAQVLDDADATGMTARVDRGMAPGNDTAP